jgi:beta-lactamase regulating signal transducer with metallopeptidase domain
MPFGQLSDIASLPAWSGGFAVFLAKATIILVAALVITRQMHRASAGARHLVWLVTLGTLLFVPALTAWAPLALRVLPAHAAASDIAVSQPAPASSRAESAIPRANNGATPASTMPASPMPASATTMSSTAPAPVPAVGRMRRAIESVSPVMSIGLTLWAAIALIIAGTLGWSAFAVRRIVRRASPLDDPAWRTPLLEVADRIGLDTPPRLLVSSDIKMPFACGVFGPAIVLPAECRAWSLDRRHSVLLHELAHVRRGDLIGHMLGRLVCALYWFHPLVWMAAKRLRSESERACDDLALSCGTRATDYAEHLLDIVTSVRTNATPVVALAMARRKEFEGRLLAILDPDLRHSTPSRRESVALMTALVLSASLVAAAAPAPRTTDMAAKPVAHGAHASPAREQLAQARQVPTPRAHDLAAAARPVSPLPPEAPKAVASRLAEPAPQAEPGNTATGQAAGPAAAPGSVNVGPGEASPASHSKDPDERVALLAKILRTDSSANLRRIAAWGLRDFSDETETGRASSRVSNRNFVFNMPATGAESPRALYVVDGVIINNSATASSIAADALANAVAHDTDAHVREMAAWALADYDHSAAVSSALGGALQHDRSEDVRATAAWALGNGGSSAAADALVAALSDSSLRVREHAAWALGNIDLRQAPTALIAMLRDPDEQSRNSAAWALYQIHDPASLPGLEAALRSAKDEETQIACLRAMAGMGDRAVDAIRGLLESSNPRIKAMAVRVLAGGEATGPWPRPRPEPRPFP